MNVQGSGQPPVFSVCVPSYNAADFIRTTVKSVIGQTFENWELIVTDDCSLDATWNELQSAFKEFLDPRIRIERNSERRGMVGNWNHCLGFARGRYVKLLCSDDFLLPDCLEREFRALEANQSANIVASPRQVVDSRGRRLFVRSGISKPGIYSGREMIRRTALAGTNIIGDPVVVSFRADALKQSGKFDTAAAYCTDLDLWVRLLLHGDLVYLDKPVGCYRLRKAATGPSIRHLTVNDFLGMVDRISVRSGLAFSPAQLRVIKAKSWVQNYARQLIYHFLARG